MGGVIYGAQTIGEAAAGVAKDLIEGDRNQSEEDINERVAEESGGWFPNLDRGSRQLTERTSEGPGNVRENVVEAALPGQLGREELSAVTPVAHDTVEGALTGGDDSHWSRQFVGGAVTDELGRFYNLGTGLNPETGERESSGVDEVTTPLWYVAGPVSKGAGVAVTGATGKAGKAARGVAKMNSGGVLSKSARASFKRVSGYMPERLRTLAKAPARESAEEGVKGATGSVVKTVDSAATNIGKAADAVPFGRTIGVVGGGAVAAGSLGNRLAGDVSAAPGEATNMTVSEVFHNPEATVFAARKGENVLGYVVALSTSGGSDSSGPTEATILVRPDGGVSTKRVQWPPKPTFDSIGEARSAYDLLNRKRTTETVDYGNMSQGPRRDDQPAQWKLPEHSRALNGGWHLYRQDHKTEDETRFLVAAYSQRGDLLYLSSEVQARESFSAFETRGEAEAAVESFNRRRNRADWTGRVPDATADKPTPADLGGIDTSGVLGTSISNSALMKIGTALFALVVGLLIFGGN